MGNSTPPAGSTPQGGSLAKLVVEIQAKKALLEGLPARIGFPSLRAVAMVIGSTEQQLFYVKKHRVNGGYLPATCAGPLATLLAAEVAPQDALILFDRADRPSLLPVFKTAHAAALKSGFSPKKTAERLAARVLDRGQLRKQIFEALKITTLTQYAELLQDTALSALSKIFADNSQHLCVPKIVKRFWDTVRGLIPAEDIACLARPDRRYALLLELQRDLHEKGSVVPECCVEVPTDDSHPAKVAALERLLGLLGRSSDAELSRKYGFSAGRLWGIRNNAPPHPWISLRPFERMIADIPLDEPLAWALVLLAPRVRNRAAVMLSYRLQGREAPAITAQSPIMSRRKLLRALRKRLGVSAGNFAQACGLQSSMVASLRHSMDITLNSLQLIGLERCLRSRNVMLTRRAAGYLGSADAIANLKAHQMFRRIRQQFRWKGRSDILTELATKAATKSSLGMTDSVLFELLRRSEYRGCVPARTDARLQFPTDVSFPSLRSDTKEEEIEIARAAKTPQDVFGRMLHDTRVNGDYAKLGGLIDDSPGLLGVFLLGHYRLSRECAERAGKVFGFSPEEWVLLCPAVKKK